MQVVVAELTQERQHGDDERQQQAVQQAEA
jgi:hypothetical protein